MTLFLSNCALTITVNCFLQLMIKQECLRKSGYSVQADEEQLRYKAVTVACVVNNLRLARQQLYMKESL